MAKHTHRPAPGITSIILRAVRRLLRRSLGRRSAGLVASLTNRGGTARKSRRLGSSAACTSVKSDSEVPGPTRFAPALLLGKV